ncbi:MAG: Xaa-Pro peptidase family protein [Anaerolineales bacterium]|nr:Xaa-Pro peptidase family protein [Anaerolineales bacterium]
MSSNASNPLLSRYTRLATILQSAGLDALVLNPCPSLTYLTGLHFHLSERPVVAIFVPEAPTLLVLPDLETLKGEGLPFQVKLFPYGEDPATWQAAFRAAFQAAGLETGQVGIEPGHLRILELRLLEAAAPHLNFISAEEALSNLRIQKDAQELNLMRKAADVAQRALQATLPQVKIGITEAELASELTLILLRHGSDPVFAFPPIISFGPNTANPHAFPSERKLAAGDLLLFDWGATYQGYASDITRTFAIGKVETELAQIAQIVKQANAAARALAAPGVAAGDIDLAARQVIEQAGYGKFFTHRTGHGLGMEIHEPPYIRSGSSFFLQLGMTFTIEPGIYLPGRGGVRVEDDCVITADGIETMTSLPRELIVLEL